MLKSIFSKINKFVSDVIDKITNKEPWYKYYDKGGKIEYPNLTIYELIEKTCNAYPNNYAFEYYGKKITYKEIFTKRIFRIIVPLFIVSIIFTFEYSGGINFNNILLFILSLFMDTGNNFIPYWLWYLYALIGLYIMTPFLKKMVLKFDKKDYKMFILFFVIGVGVLNLISSIILVFFCFSYAFNSSFMNTIFSNTVGLYVLGYYLYNSKVSDKLKNYTWIILICRIIIKIAFKTII